jgi:hypothetical protein
VTSTEKAQFWHNHFKAWQGSDLSQAAYCRQHDLKLSTFAYWRTRANQRQRKLLPLPSPVSRERIFLDLPCGIRMDLSAVSLSDVLPVVLRSLRDAG